jgi:murein DD-endopeptidase MepM/ murein hydrolase activator NlpD
MVQSTAARCATLVAVTALAGACTPPPPPPPPAPPPFQPLVTQQEAGPDRLDTLGLAVTGTIAKRESLSVALGHVGVGAREVDELLRALAGHLEPRHVRPGDVYRFLRDPLGRLAWFRYQSGPLHVVHATRAPDGALVAHSEAIRVERIREFVAGEIEEGSLYMAMDAAGEGPALTLAFVDLFAWDIDFFTSTQPHDRFRLIVEKQYVDGRFIGYGRVLAGEYRMAQGKTYRAFFYEHGSRAGYYTADGEAVEKSFLKSPLQFASITSKFGYRFHPIINQYGTHKGVDYGAPAGTAVWAVGDGTVTFAGPNGGYGNVVYIRHANGFETRYAHLSAFGKAAHSGKHIAQKDVLGYVGATGLATGPHLHFEVLQGGRHTDPLRVVAPPAPPIPKDELPSYKEAIRPIEQALSAGNPIAER